MLKIIISGIAGRMGQRILSLAQKDASVEVIGGIEIPQRSAAAGEKVKVYPNLDAQIEEFDCLIEFTNPTATLKHLETLSRIKKPAVIGTTGFTPEETRQIESAAKEIPIVFSPNMSVGVNILFSATRFLVKKLKHHNYKAKIIEAHHSHKKDAPSGTAKRIAQIIKEEGMAVDDIQSIREGEIVGDHKIIFESPVDTLELFHSAKTRDIFAQGAILAAKWLAGKSPGLYSMQTVLEE